MLNITKVTDGFTVALTVPEGEQFMGCAIESIGMFVAATEADCHGDLAVTWNTTGLENTGGSDMGSLLMRNWDDAVGAVMGEFYWNQGYSERLQELLMAAGVPETVALSVGTSEWGMQDEGRASYDAFGFADWIREQVAITA